MRLTGSQNLNAAFFFFPFSSLYEINTYWTIWRIMTYSDIDLTYLCSQHVLRVRDDDRVCGDHRDSGAEKYLPSQCPCRRFTRHHFRSGWLMSPSGNILSSRKYTRTSSIENSGWTKYPLIHLLILSSYVPLSLLSRQTKSCLFSHLLFSPC